MARLRSASGRVEDRPRERLYHKGAEALADAELLAIQLGTGVPGTVRHGRGARDAGAARLALRARGARRRGARAHVRGVGRVRAVRLAAAFEITRRLRSRNGTGRVVLSSPEQVFARYGPLMEDLKKEVFRVALLDAQNGLLRDVVISEGTLSASLVHPREVFKPAILESAASVILLHNHPSGDPIAEPRGPSAHAAAGRLLEAARSAHPRPRHHRPRAVREPGPARSRLRTPRGAERSFSPWRASPLPSSTGSAA